MERSVRIVPAFDQPPAGFEDRRRRAHNQGELAGQCSCGNNGRSAVSGNRSSRNDQRFRGRPPGVMQALAPTSSARIGAGRTCASRPLPLVTRLALIVGSTTIGSVLKL